MLLLVASGCQFGSSQPGSGGGLGEGSTGSTATNSTDGPTVSTTVSTIGTTGPGGEGSGEGTTVADSATTADEGDDATTATVTTSTATTNDDSSDDAATTSAVNCDSTWSVIAWVEDGVATTPPMEIAPAWGGLPGMPDVAYTPSASGDVTFELEVPCDGNATVFTLTWDLYRGGGPCGVSHSDSFDVGLDGGATNIFWGYGCANCDGNDQEWFWADVEDFTGLNDCDIGVPWTPYIEAGTRTLTFGGRESGDANLPTPNASAIAAVLISNDPAFDPNTVFQP